MFSRILTRKSTKDCSGQTDKLKKALQEADAVVIGAGNGGLAAACRMAKAGKKTLLIERHNMPGGCASSFRRGRFEFETALHEISEWGTKENPGGCRRICDEFGLDIPGRRRNPTSRT